MRSNALECEKHEHSCYSFHDAECVTETQEGAALRFDCRNTSKQCMFGVASLTSELA